MLEGGRVGDEGPEVLPELVVDGVGGVDPYPGPVIGDAMWNV